MATQKCPKCGSDRIRPGYRKTSIISKLMFRYNLLCNACNLEFKGFAIPGTLGSKSKKTPKKFSDPNYRSPEQVRQTKSVVKIEVQPLIVEEIEAEKNDLIETNQIEVGKTEVEAIEEISSTEKKSPKKVRNKVKVKQRVKVRF